jgi:adenine phosphoribosyltransferase
MQINLKDYIKEVQDFPTKGIGFKDITPLLASPKAFGYALDELSILISESFPEVNVIAGIEARGFILGAPIAGLNSLGFVPIRKEGKLPHPKVATYATKEYGTDILEVKENERAFEDIIIVDDVLATGGTITAAEHLLNAAGYNVVGAIVLIDLTFLHSDIKIGGKDVVSLIQY